MFFDADLLYGEKNLYMKKKVLDPKLAIPIIYTLLWSKYNYRCTLELS